jgi:hypothetical protein
MRETAKIRGMKRQRAKWELEIFLIKYLNEFKSAEEPAIELTDKEKLEVVAKILHACISEIK